MATLQKYTAEFDALLLADRGGREGDPLAAVVSRWASYTRAESGELVTQASGRFIVLEDRHGRVASDHFLTGQFVLELVLTEAPGSQDAFTEMLEDTLGQAAVTHLWEGLEAVSSGPVVLLESEEAD